MLNLAGMEHVIGGKFKLGRKIGSGSFGELYLGTFLVGFSDLSSIAARCEAPFVFLLLTVYAVCDDVVDSWIVSITGVNLQSSEEVAIKLVCEDDFVSDI